MEKITSTPFRRENKKIILVDVRSCGFLVDPVYYYYGWSGSSKILGRKSAVEALMRAEKLLPSGCRFKVWDCYRSRKTQILMQEAFRRKLRLLHPKLSSKEIHTLLEKFGGISPPPLRVEALGTHRKGGSFDLTLIDARGRELLMGTAHDDLTSKAALDYFEKKPNPDALDKKIRDNRRLLKKVMEQAGFVSYPPEWWHWSFDN